MNISELTERFIQLETSVENGFKNVNLLFTNHLSSHAKREKFHERLIIALVAIAGSLAVSLIMMGLHIVSNK